MARECGWDHGFIGRTFTLRQIRRYHEAIVKQKKEDLRLLAIVVANSAAYANGGDVSKFEEFINSLDVFKSSSVDSLKTGIDEGIIEVK